MLHAPAAQPHASKRVCADAHTRCSAAAATQAAGGVVPLRASNGYPGPRTLVFEEQRSNNVGQATATSIADPLAPRGPLRTKRRYTHDVPSHHHHTALARGAENHNGVANIDFNVDTDSDDSDSDGRVEVHVRYPGIIHPDALRAAALRDHARETAARIQALGAVSVVAAAAPRDLVARSFAALFHAHDPRLRRVQPTCATLLSPPFATWREHYSSLALAALPVIATEHQLLELPSVPLALHIHSALLRPAFAELYAQLPHVAAAAGMGDSLPLSPEDIDILLRCVARDVVVFWLRETWVGFADGIISVFCSQVD